jgi:hypothetical protein
MGPLLEGVPGIPILLFEVLESVVTLQGIPKELPRVRGLDTTIGPLSRLVHTGPHGPWTTLQKERCQTDIIPIWSGTQVVLNNADPLLHLRVLLLVPIPGRRCRTETIHVPSRCWATAWALTAA